MIVHRLAPIAIALSLCLPGSVLADTVKGRIMEISKLSSQIQLEVTGKDPVLVTFGPGTKFEQAANIDDLGAPDLVEVHFEPGQPATLIKKVIFALPAGVEIDTQQMIGILTSGKPYTLIDARPKKQYVQGHVPSAKVAFPKDEDFMSKLPADKDELLVFYCGGPTCPYTSEAVDKAIASGHTNVKGYQAGIPGWKREKLPVHASASWVAENLNEAHVVIDTRDLTASAAKNIPGAVAMPAVDFQNLTATFIREKRKAVLPGVTDVRAPIILYSDTHADANVLQAYKELRDWGYRNVSILEGGLNAWAAANLPTASGALSGEIRFVKRLAPGAIAPEDFAALVSQPEGKVFLDVRSDKEISGGILKGAVHIALEKLEGNLDKLPKDQEVIAYCANGIRAEMAYQKLTKLGYTVRFLNENIEISKDGSYRL